MKNKNSFKTRLHVVTTFYSVTKGHLGFLVIPFNEPIGDSHSLCCLGEVDVLLVAIDNAIALSNVSQRIPVQCSLQKGDWGIGI